MRTLRSLSILAALGFCSVHALTVTSLKAYQVIQRTSNGSADFAVAGTRGTSVTDVQFQLTAQGSSTPLTGFSWKSTLATVTGTSWAGTLTALPVGGEYTVSFRGVNASGASVETGPTVEHVLVGDVWVASGQSNMGGTSEATSSPYVHQYDAGSDSWSLTRHNLSVAFGKTVYQNSGVPVGITMIVCSGAAIT